MEKADNPRGSLWVQRVGSAVLGILVTVVAAIIVQKLESREPRLVFTSVETVPFNGPNNVIGIYQTVVRNEGKAEVDDVSCYIRIPGATIEQHRVIVPPSLQVQEGTIGDALRVEIPSLNPGELAQISILANNPTHLPNHPEISVRAKGVNASEQAPSVPSQQPERYLSLLTAMAGTLAVASTFGFRRLFSKGMGGSQASTLQSICRMHGLSDRADQYKVRRGINYYGEADRLGQEAVQSHDPRTVADIKKILLAISSIDRMWDSSRAIVLYNLARISAKEGASSEVTNYLDEARRLSREEVDGRVRIDPLLTHAEGAGA